MNLPEIKTIEDMKSLVSQMVIPTKKLNIKKLNHY